MEEIRNNVVKLEDNLRDMVDTIMNRTYGVKWEDNIDIGWTKKKKEDLTGIRKSRVQKFPEQIHSARLLDYGYVYHLKFIIERNEKLFKPIFSNFKRILEFMEILGENRNLLMHTDEIEEYQKHLCLGIIGTINQSYLKWKNGYRNKAKGWLVEYRLYEKKSISDEAVKKNFENQITRIINNMKNNDYSVNDTRIDNSRNIKFAKNYQIITIQLGNMSTGNFGEYGEFWTKNLRIETDNYESLVEILSINDIRYWAFRWIIPEGLDAITTIHNIEKIRNTHHSGSKVIEDGQLTGIGINHYLENGKNRSVRVDVMGGIKHPTTITLVYDGAGPDAGFINAHKIITPDELLTIMYGDRTPNQIRRLIDESC